MSEVQSVVFPKNKFSTTQARAFLKANNFNPIKRVDVTENTLRYRIVEPEKFKRIRTIKIKDGISLIIGFKK